MQNLFPFLDAKYFSIKTDLRFGFVAHDSLIQMSLRNMKTASNFFLFLLP